MHSLNKFKLKSSYKPAGDQPQAIEKLVKGLKRGDTYQTLLGVTGSGKTFSIANVIKEVQRPTLVIAHNKTLAAQLASEFRLFFPDNAVEYFVSYYDYYQPEAYVPGTDTYIEKEANINDEIERLRHAATNALLTRRDVIIVASVSCIYGLGSPEEYASQHISISIQRGITREELIKGLISIHYERTEILKRGSFRAHGETIEIMPPEREAIIRLEFKQSALAKIIEYDALTRAVINEQNEIELFPAKHFVVSNQLMQSAFRSIEAELEERLKYLRGNGKLLEAERLERRTRYDLEMMREIGYCSGIENYSRYLSGRKSGESPHTLIDFFPKDFLMVVDESHVTVPQIGGMYAGDRSRKETLVEYGFRLPSALDNRPLMFNEFEQRINQLICVSATPGGYELKRSAQVAEQIVRPTGLIDPEIVLKPAKDQVRDLIEEIKITVGNHERVLVTTLTKRQAEQLTEYLTEQDIKTNYLHSEVQTLERVRVLEKLRRGDYDVLVGVNLLREGLDLPEVSLVVILDADKEGFLRSETSLIQTMGRAARNVRGRVILYADNTTGSMERAINEADRRRKIQIKYNLEHAITPQSIQKAVASIVDHEMNDVKPVGEYTRMIDFSELPELIRSKEKEMKNLAGALKFEDASILRDEIIELKRLMRTN